MPWRFPLLQLVEFYGFLWPPKQLEFQMLLRTGKRIPSPQMEVQLPLLALHSASLETNLIQFPLPNMVSSSGPQLCGDRCVLNLLDTERVAAFAHCISIQYLLGHQEKQTEYAIHSADSSSMVLQIDTQTFECKYLRSH